MNHLQLFESFNDGMIDMETLFEIRVAEKFNLKKYDGEYFYDNGTDGGWGPLLISELGEVGGIYNISRGGYKNNQLEINIRINESKISPTTFKNYIDTKLEEDSKKLGMGIDEFYSPLEDDFFYLRFCEYEINELFGAAGMADTFKRELDDIKIREENREIIEDYFIEMIDDKISVNIDEYLIHLKRETIVGNKIIITFKTKLQHEIDKKVKVALSRLEQYYEILYKNKYIIQIKNKYGWPKDTDMSEWLITIKPIDDSQVSFIKESKSEEIEEIEDYFQELQDHKDDKYPISIEVTNHLVNKTTTKPLNKYLHKAPNARRDKYKYIIGGYKICILYDFYDQEYVKKSVNTAILRLKRDYNIHYDQISKSGNGYNHKKIPVHGTDRFSHVSDPIWKRTITISPKSITESSQGYHYLDNIEDVFDIVLEDDKIPHKRTSFDFLTKTDIYTQGKYRIVHGNVSNSDLLTGINLMRDAIVCDLPTAGDNEWIKEKFKRVIQLYPNILIYVMDRRVAGGPLDRHSITRSFYSIRVLFVMNPLTYEEEEENDIDI